MFCFAITTADSVDPDQMATLEYGSSGSTLISRARDLQPNQ